MHPALVTTPVKAMGGILNDFAWFDEGGDCPIRLVRPSAPQIREIFSSRCIGKVGLRHLQTFRVSS